MIDQLGAFVSEQLERRGAHLFWPGTVTTTLEIQSLTPPQEIFSVCGSRRVFLPASA